MIEDHTAIEELLAGYVLRSLTGEDASEADRLLSDHVPICSLCRQTLAGFLGIANDALGPLRRIHLWLGCVIGPSGQTRDENADNRAGTNHGCSPIILSGVNSCISSTPG